MNFFFFFVITSSDPKHDLRYQTLTNRSTNEIYEEQQRSPTRNPQIIFQIFKSSRLTRRGSIIFITKNIQTKVFIFIVKIMKHLKKAEGRSHQNVVKRWRPNILINKMFLIYTYGYRYILREGIPRDVVSNVLDCEIVVSEFEIQSRYYVYLRILLGKVWTPLFPSYELDSTITLLYQVGFDIT